MSKLNKLLERQTQEIPKIFLRELVAEKLEEQGFDDRQLVNSLTDHILEMDGSEFQWDDGDDSSTKSLVIEFTEQDAENLSKDVESFLKNDLPKVIRKTVKRGAKTLVKELEENWPEMKVDYQTETRGFRDRLDLRWASGLDPLRMMLFAAQDAGQLFADKLARSKAKKGIVKREAIMLLHMRACKTVLEILTLLEHGLPDGALARWRTLYELSVVAFVIDRFGDECAERYLAHEVVSMRESLVNEFRYNGEDYQPETLDDELKGLEEDFQSALLKYGKPFASPYGWAAHNLGKKNPRFQDLEIAGEWEALPPEYKWSSFEIHAGVAGAYTSLGVIDDELIIHAGAININLETPAINTAYSLLHITSILFGKKSDIDTQLELNALIVLRDKVRRKCTKIAKEIAKDEMRIRNGSSASKSASLM